MHLSPFSFANLFLLLFERKWSGFAWNSGTLSVWQQTQPSIVCRAADVGHIKDRGTKSIKASRKSMRWKSGQTILTAAAGSRRRLWWARGELSQSAPLWHKCDAVGLSSRQPLHLALLHRTTTTSTCLGTNTMTHLPPPCVCLSLFFAPCNPLFARKGAPDKCCTCCVAFGLHADEIKPGYIHPLRAPSSPRNYRCTRPPLINKVCQFDCNSIHSTTCASAPQFVRGFGTQTFARDAPAEASIDCDLLFGGCSAGSAKLPE